MILVRCPPRIVCVLIVILVSCPTGVVSVLIVILVHCHGFNFDFSAPESQ